MMSRSHAGSATEVRDPLMTLCIQGRGLVQLDPNMLWSSTTSLYSQEPAGPEAPPDWVRCNSCIMLATRSVLSCLLNAEMAESDRIRFLITFLPLLLERSAAISANVRYGRSPGSPVED